MLSPKTILGLPRPPVDAVLVALYATLWPGSFSSLALVELLGNGVLELRPT